MRAIGLAVIALVGGCDVVFGLSGDPGPCDPTSFASATPRAITTADAFSISWDQTLAVLTASGVPYELALPDGMPTPIDLGVYSDSTLALAPEGTSLFFTAAVEPPLLEGALRASESSWSVVTRVPAGTFAGTPSADGFGPRRVLVRLYAASPEIQEYEDDDGVWTPHGDVHAVPGTFAPNLTPSGLTMVYLGPDPVTSDPAVLLATRGSVDEWFGDPVPILAGTHRSPQLLGNCKALYVVDDTNTLSEYDLP